MVHTVHLSLVLFSIVDESLVVYLPNNRLPSRPLAHGETLEAARKKLFAEIPLQESDAYVEQLYTTEDPFEQGSIVVVYFALCSHHELPKQVFADMRRAILPSASFPEKAILAYAIQRLRWKIEYTNVVYSLLPVSFTLTELQRVYEAILGKKLDKRNFRKKMLSLGILKDTGKKKVFGRARPAEIYTFKNRTPTIVEIL